MSISAVVHPRMTATALVIQYFRMQWPERVLPPGRQLESKGEQQLINTALTPVI
jgi:hypothetical protein